MNSVDCMRRLATLPLPLRRRLLRAAWRMQPAVGMKLGFGLDTMMRHVLRLSAAEARQADREFHYHDTMAVMDWMAILERDLAGVRRDLDATRFEDPDSLARIAASGRPVILATLHMGAYPLGLGAVMRRFFAGRRMLIVRARDDREQETAAMERIREFGVDMRFLKVSDRKSFVSAVRFAKEGSVIAFFVDLPQSYGKPADIRLFGRPARIALGIDAFARLVDGVVVPVVVNSRPDGEYVRIRRPFEVHDREDERARVAEQVRRHIEMSVIETPSQWHFWPRLEEFLVEEAPLPQAA